MLPDGSVLLLTKSRTYPAEVNSKLWSCETSARGVSPPSTKKTVAFTTENRTITVMTVDASLSRQYRIPDDRRALIERLLIERISLRGICRMMGVGLKWLLGFLVQCFEALPDHLNVQPITCIQDVMI
jgi:hypothetical protein